MESAGGPSWRLLRNRRPGQPPAASGGEARNRGGDRRRAAQRILPGPAGWAGRLSPTDGRGRGVERRAAPQRTRRAQLLPGKRPPGWPVRKEHSAALKLQSERQLRSVQPEDFTQFWHTGSSSSTGGDLRRSFRGVCRRDPTFGRWDGSVGAAPVQPNRARPK